MEMVEKFIDANILNNPIGAICFIVFLLVVILPLTIGRERLPGHYLEIAVGVGVLAIVCFFAIGYKGIPENGKRKVEQIKKEGNRKNSSTKGDKAQGENNAGSRNGDANDKGSAQTEQNVEKNYSKKLNRRIVENTSRKGSRQTGEVVGAASRIELGTTIVKKTEGDGSPIIEGVTGNVTFNVGSKDAD